MSEIENLDKALSLVAMNIGDKSRILDFSWWAVSQLYLLKKVNILTDEVPVAQPDMTVALLWAALITHSPELDGLIASDGTPSEKAQNGIAQVGKWMSITGLPEVVTKLTAALTAAAKKEASEKKA